MKKAAPLALLLASLSVAACEDPSNVGVGLVGEGGGEPVVERVELAEFEDVEGTDVTGGTQLVLAGRVNDPLLGTLSATGHLDFDAVGGADVAGFRDTTLASATLQLVPDYAYGDTTTEVTLQLSSVPDEFNAAGATADTTLPAGEPIATFRFAPTDTLVSVPLPEAWIAANDTTLRSTRATSIFHGFQIAPAPGSASAVVGFDRRASRLQAIAGADTVLFGEGDSGVKGLSSLARAGEPAVPDGRVLFQDGVGPRLRVGFDFDADSLVGNALNRAELRLYPDTLALDGSGSFVRPRPATLLLFGVDEDGGEVVSAVGELDEEGGYYVFGGAGGTGVQFPLRVVLQRYLLGETPFDHFEIVVPSGVNTLSPLLFYGPGTGETAPQLELVLTEPDL